jgi:hypothetical protein
MLVRILLPFLVTDWHYHKCGPEKMRGAHNQFLVIYLYSILLGGKNLKYRKINLVELPEKWNICSIHAYVFVNSLKCNFKLWVLYAFSSSSSILKMDIPAHLTIYYKIFNEHYKAMAEQYIAWKF